MTDWDRAYLDGLYAADPSKPSSLQNGQVLARMEAELSAAAAAH